MTGKKKGRSKGKSFEPRASPRRLSRGRRGGKLNKAAVAGHVSRELGRKWCNKREKKA